MWLLSKLLQSRIVRYVALVATFVLGVLGYGALKRKEGAENVKDDMVQEDLENAIRIRKDMDAAQEEADRTANAAKFDAVLDELRKRGRLRD